MPPLLLSLVPEFLFAEDDVVGLAAGSSGRVVIAISLFRLDDVDTLGPSPFSAAAGLSVDSAAATLA